MTTIEQKTELESIPVITLELHQRTALDHVRDTETFTLVAYANNQLALDRPGEYARLICRVVVDRPYIVAESIEEWRGDVLRAVERKALTQHIPGVWRSTDGEICGDYYRGGI